MQRKRELKNFMPQNTHQFPLILDAWLPVERRGDHVDKFSDEKFLFVSSRTNKTTIIRKDSLEKN